MDHNEVMTIIFQEVTCQGDFYETYHHLLNKALLFFFFLSQNIIFEVTLFVSLR